MPRRPPWLPLLLSTLALAIVLGGLAVGHFYWTTLRESMGRMEHSMSLARERQQGLVEQLARSRALVAERKRRVQAEAEALAQAVGELRERPLVPDPGLLAEEIAVLAHALRAAADAADPASAGASDGIGDDGVTAAAPP